MSAMKDFNLKILAADKIIYEGSCCNMVVPLLDGYMGFRANHSNMISGVKTGVMTYQVSEEDAPVNVAVSDGLIKVEDNDILVLVDAAEKADSIDIARAKRAEEASRQRLLKEQSRKAQLAAEADLARAITRIAASTKGGVTQKKDTHSAKP